MEALTAGAVIAVVLLGAALLVVWTRRETWLRAAAIPLALVAAAAASIAVISVLGFAVPLIGGLTAPSGQLHVLSAKMVVGQGIYLTLDLPGAPRLYWLPWDKALAEKLQDMLADPGNAGVMAVTPPYEWSWDIHKPEFQPLPQPKMPDKPPVQDAPHFAA